MKGCASRPANASRLLVLPQQAAVRPVQTQCSFALESLEVRAVALARRRCGLRPQQTVLGSASHRAVIGGAWRERGLTHPSSLAGRQQILLSGDRGNQPAIAAAHLRRVFRVHGGVRDLARGLRHGALREQQRIIRKQAPVQLRRRLLERAAECLLQAGQALLCRRRHAVEHVSIVAAAEVRKHVTQIALQIGA
jgi:hypothetical protein